MANGTGEGGHRDEVRIPFHPEPCWLSSGPMTLSEPTRANALAQLPSRGRSSNCYRLSPWLLACTVIAVPHAPRRGLAVFVRASLLAAAMAGFSVVVSAGAPLIIEFPIPTAASAPRGITAGPDGNLWFTEASGNNIGRITAAGAITEFPIPTVGSGPQSITAGPDGNLWFTEFSGNKIGQITPAGAITEFPICSVGGCGPRAGGP